MLTRRGRLHSRLALLISLLVLALLATACGETSPPPTATMPTSTQKTTCPPSGSAQSLTGAGATFPMPLYQRWFNEYNELCGVKVNYQGFGSGGGIQQHSVRTIDFGASDSLMTEKQKQNAPGTLMIPMTAGAVAVVVNVEGIQPGQVKLTPETLAAIYLGKIVKWNDPALAADNPGVNLPDQNITVIRRADGSGTTNIFTSYLSQISSEWRERVGVGNSVQWPTGIGGEGNAGVAGLVKQVSGSLGYVELAYATQNDMAWVTLQNQAGNFIEPSLKATTAAMEGIDLPDSTEILITNSTADEAYPIAGMTWILAYEHQPNKAKAQSLAHLLWWAVHDGQSLCEELGYASLSPAVVQKAEALIGMLKVDGQAVLGGQEMIE